MAGPAIKRLARELCPPVFWKAAGHFTGGRLSLLLGTALAGRLTRRVVTTLEELDREIARADEAARVSDDALRAVLNSFCFRPRLSLPRDPDSPEYREAPQFDLYRLVSGRPVYRSSVCEQTEVRLDAHTTCPFPYMTRSSTTVGEHLMAIGFLIRALGFDPAHRILEFGVGWGKTTIEFAQMGYSVTAVDISPLYLDLVRDRCRMLGLEIQTACADMLDFEPAGRYDRVVFYECFHHCSDHAAMVRKLDGLVAPGGRVLFAGEPITDWFDRPWGLRLDGMSAWSIRKFGWLELGFRTDYFLRLLARNGWAVETHFSADVPWQRVFVARRASETS